MHFQAAIAVSITVQRVLVVEVAMDGPGLDAGPSRDTAHRRVVSLPVVKSEDDLGATHRGVRQ